MEALVSLIFFGLIIYYFVKHSQEKAIHPYIKDDEYIEGYCLDREEIRTFRIDRIVKFTWNSEAIFNELN